MKLRHGGIEEQDVPQPDAQAVLAQAIIVLLTFILTNESEVTTSTYGIQGGRRPLTHDVLSDRPPHRHPRALRRCHADQARYDLGDNQAVTREGLQAGGPPVGQRRMLIR